MKVMVDGPVHSDDLQLAWFSGCSRRPPPLGSGGKGCHTAEMYLRPGAPPQGSVHGGGA